MSPDTTLPNYFHATALNRRGEAVRTRYLRGTDTHRTVAQWMASEDVRAHKVKLRPVTAGEMGLVEVSA